MASSTSTTATPTKPQDGSRSLLKGALLASTAVSQPSRADKKRDYETRLAKYVSQAAAYKEKKLRQQAKRMADKRSAGYRGAHHARC